MPELLLAREVMEEERLRYPLPRGGLVVDLGAYNGDFAYHLFRVYGCRVLCVEPAPDFAQALRDRFAPWPELTVLEAAAGSADGHIDLHLAGDRTGSDDTIQGPTIQVRQVDIATLITQQVDLLKVNIEGAEYDVLERLLDTGKLAYITHLQVQFHRWGRDYQQRHDAIRERLATTHSCTWRMPWVWESWTRV